MCTDKEYIKYTDHSKVVLLVIVHQVLDNAASLAVGENGWNSKDNSHKNASDVIRGYWVLVSKFSYEVMVLEVMDNIPSTAYMSHG